jgi:predicted HicB family RNase H-like nuclease
MGQGAFMSKAINQASVNSAPAEEVAQVSSRTRARGQKPMVAMSFRISRQDWERLHLLAITDGVSINTLTLRGLSKLFEERGLPGIAVG